MLHFADGWDHYLIRVRSESHDDYDPEGGQALRKWDAFYLDDDGDPEGVIALYTGTTGAHGLAGRFEVRLTTQAGYLARTFAAPRSQWTVGFALYLITAPTPDAGLVSWHAAGDPEGAVLGLDGGGSLWVGDASGTKLATSAESLTPFEWHYVEWRVVVGGAGAGQYEVRLDAATVLAGTGDTLGAGAALVDELRVGSVLTTEGQWAYDDLYVTAEDGGALQGFLAPPDGTRSVLVHTYLPSGERELSGTPYENEVPFEEGAESWSALFEMGATDDDTTQIEGGGPDVFDMRPYDSLSDPEDPPDATVFAPAAIQWVASARPATGAADLQRLIEVDGDRQAGPSLPLDPVTGAGYTFAREVLETNPATGLDWAAGDLDGIGAGYQTGELGGILRVSQLVLEVVIGLGVPPVPLPGAPGRNWVVWWPD